MFNSKIKNIIGYSPQKISLYRKAFTHSSLNIKDSESNPYNFERLEYLGDSVLNLVVASHLFSNLSSSNEGDLTTIKSKIVSRDNLNKIGKKYNLIDLLSFNGKKERFGQDINGNILEALIGAVFIDKGYLNCKKLIEKIIITPYPKNHLNNSKIVSYKSEIIQWGQKNKNKIQFVLEEKISENKKLIFHCLIYINNTFLLKASGISKKKSEEKAAIKAFEILQIKK